MLKIKDGIDLKELEKFGYRDESHAYEKDMDWQKVCISKETRTIYWVSDDDYDYVEYGYYDSLADDLIKAGLVEEVKEK